MKEVICYIAQIAIPVWVVISIVIVITLIRENVELENRITEMIATLGKSSSACNDLGKISRELIDADRNEIAIFESKTSELVELRSKYEFRIQEVSEYLDSFAIRLSKCCDAVNANGQKTNLIDKDVESCSKAIVLLKNEIDDMKKKGVTVWDVTVSDWDPPVMTCDDGN